MHENSINPLEFLPPSNSYIWSTFFQYVIWVKYIFNWTQSIQHWLLPCLPNSLSFPRSCDRVALSLPKCLEPRGAVELSCVCSYLLLKSFSHFVQHRLLPPKQWALWGQDFSLPLLWSAPLPLLTPRLASAPALTHDSLGIPESFSFLIWKVG